MSFIRGVFLFAFIMLIAGILGSRYVLAPLFRQPTIPAASGEVAQVPTVTATSKPTVAPTHLPVVTKTTIPTVTATSRATPPALPTARPAIHHRPKLAAHRRVASHQPALAHGTVELSNYWVARSSVRRGSLLAVGYVIRNSTGQTARVLLGASIKASRILSWSDSISDPGHDVVAIVPPGVTVHTRYFTVARSLRPGAYDVAWGLRNAGTGERNALATAPAVLRVSR